MAVWVLRLIPAYTGQIPEAALIHSYVPVHPHIHGADTKFPKKIPVTEGQLLPPQNPMTESVCIIFSECIFADNTFWSFLMFFRKKKRCQWHLFLELLFHHDILFLVCTQSVHKCLHTAVRFYAFAAVEDSHAQRWLQA